MDGKYSISVTPNDVLVFSYVGYEKQEIKVGQQTVINVTLKDDSQMLAETVIIGYGSAKKRDPTGSITNIKGSEIANKPATNPLSSLQGKIAGVQIVNSGQAGADPEIRIRGTNSINGYKPLYVVDGLFNDNINFPNPEDIESMEVLKDPSSLAIFGVRGANGVIIVTTKRAKEGQTLVNINTSFGWKSVVDKIKMVNAPQFKELYNEQMANQEMPCSTSATGMRIRTGKTRSSRRDSLQTTMSASQVLLKNIASISAWVTLTNRETSSMKNTAK